VEGMEGDVVDDCIVGCVDCSCGDFWTCFLKAVEVPKTSIKDLLEEVPMTDGGVVGCSDEMALFMRIPRETVAILLATERRRLYPSRVCPLRRISGLQSLLAGEFGCFVRSNTRTSPLTDMVAMMSGFWG
jgi:hypothetical protein